jgi:type VI secretion system protein ImpH
MAPQDWTDDNRLVEALAGRVRDFSFFQLIRFLEKHSRCEVRVGGAGPAEGEHLRFRPETSLGFPSTDVVAIEPVSASQGSPARLRITTTFLGLYGSTSPLPTCYSEEILWEDPDRSRVRDFLDIFHHRLISLFYRCWCKYRYPIEFEHGKDDPITPRLFALICLSSPALVQATGIPDSWRLLHFSGLFHHQPHSAADLERLLTDYFDGLQVELEQCTGRWVPILQEQMSSLGRNCCRLGVDCSIGKRVYGRMTSFRVWIGPCDYDRMLDFIPDQDNYRVLCRIVNLFVKDPLEFDIGLRVRSLPQLRLDSEAPSRRSPRLGWNTWLFSNLPEKEKEETVVF